MRVGKIDLLKLCLCRLYFRLCSEFEEGQTLDVNNPGCYPTVCVELDLASLAVNTIIEVMSMLISLCQYHQDGTTLPSTLIGSVFIV